MRSEKKKALSMYLLQETKISRLKTMSLLHPESAERYQTEIEQAQEFRRITEIAIEQVDGGVLSELLYQKYIFGKTLDDISCILNYSPRQVERMHVKALDLYVIPTPGQELPHFSAE